jgi:hypothetical protein
MLHLGARESGLEASTPANTKLGAAKLAAGNIDYCLARADFVPFQRWPAAAFWCESPRADFYRLLEPTPQSAIDVTILPTLPTLPPLPPTCVFADPVATSAMLNTAAGHQL